MVSHQMHIHKTFDKIKQKNLILFALDVEMFDVSSF